MHFIARGGKIVANVPREDYMDERVGSELRRMEVFVSSLNSDEVAASIKAPRSQNLVLIGFAAAVGALPFTLDEIKGAIETVTPPAFLAKNIEALEAGYESFAEGKK